MTAVGGDPPITPYGMVLFESTLKYKVDDFLNKFTTADPSRKAPFFVVSAIRVNKENSYSR